MLIYIRPELKVIHGMSIHLQAQTGDVGTNQQSQPGTSGQMEIGCDAAIFAATVKLPPGSTTNIVDAAIISTPALANLQGCTIKFTHKGGEDTFNLENDCTVNFYGGGNFLCTCTISTALTEGQDTYNAGIDCSDLGYGIASIDGCDA
ncbi:MAG: hypothetical protein Q8Q33_01560 [Chlamydiota bacterium]|nr:hypothetical protein [Chlamydiota bacterium]